MTELNDFLNNILPKIGEESCIKGKWFHLKIVFKVT